MSPLPFTVVTPFCIIKGSGERIKPAALQEGYIKSPMDFSTELLTLLAF